MESEHGDRANGKKKPDPTDRKLTTPLFLLRCLQIGLSIQELDLLTIGLVMDIFTESINDHCDDADAAKGARPATQEDFDNF